MNRDHLVSCIIPINNTESKTIDYIRHCHAFLKKDYNDFEIIVVTTPTYESPELLSLLETLDSIRVLFLSGEIDTQSGYYSGLTTAIGDVIILTTTDNTIESLEESLTLSIVSSFDLITGISKTKKRFFYRFFRMIYFLIFKRLSPNTFPKNVSTLRVLSRSLTQLIIKKKTRPDQLFVFLSQINLPQSTIVHNCSPLHKSSIILGLQQGISHIVYSSTKPLKFVSLLGILGSLLGFSISIYALSIHFIKDRPIEGWTSLTLFSSMQFFFIFIILFFFGEYLARSIDQKEGSIEDRVLFEKNSTYLESKSRYNIVSEENY